MSAEVVIKLENVNKTFQIDEGVGVSILDIPRSIFGVKKAREKKIVNAITDVNVKIEKGEFFGIVGRNGSGKSTLLNLMIGAIRPDKGSIITTKGKIVRLALGMGFDPNLTARDNIYVNASILGLTFKRIGLIFDDIIGFAELEKFVDYPVKNFSSGMISKLKFSIAIYAEADIFLMDEFFGGVGDESFKSKSSKVFENTFLDGRTIIHVSHQLGTIKKHCKRVLLLDHGKQIMVDHPDVVIPAYKKIFQEAKIKKQKLAQKEVILSEEKDGLMKKPSDPIVIKKDDANEKTPNLLEKEDKINVSSINKTDESGSKKVVLELDENQAEKQSESHNAKNSGKEADQLSNISKKISPLAEKLKANSEPIEPSAELVKNEKLKETDKTLIVTDNDKLEVLDSDLKKTENSNKISKLKDIIKEGKELDKTNDVDEPKIKD